jgi:prophage antirepressor-like protein
MSNRTEHEKAPTAPTVEADEAERQSTRNNAMTDNTTNVIPFKFGNKQVRTLLVYGQPWFVANDVSAALQYSEASAMTRHLDEDEKGLSILQTLGGEQEMLVINESGLYSAILRSRKAEAKRFKKWVTSEVLPAIRKHGHYEDQGKMATLIGQTIGTDGFHMLASIVKGKVSSLPAVLQRRASAKIWSQAHAAFGVRSAADIPVEQLDSARNFIAAYVVLEGEFMPQKSVEGDRLNIHFPIQALACRREGMFKDRGDGYAWLDVCLEDVGYQHGSLCEVILFELQRAGYVVDAARWELATYRNKLRGIDSFVRGLNKVIEEPQRYAIVPGDAA